MDWGNEKECLEAVKENGLALEYVENQTLEICLAAVNQNGCAIKYVEDQTLEICLVAINQNKRALKFIKYQIEEIYFLPLNEIVEIYNMSNIKQKKRVWKLLTGIDIL